jgi:FkbM family methyltransferase
MFETIRKPWFVYQPGQVFRRALFAIRPSQHGLCRLTTSWGGVLLADPSRVVGASIAMTGVFDLAVTEALLRLVEPGETVIDAGANIGYMSVLLSNAVGKHGRLFAFEPHPELFSVLQQNIAVSNAAGCSVHLYRAALGARSGAGFLVVPTGFDVNDGLSHMTDRHGDPRDGFAVDVVTLDDVLGESRVQLMKLDVEGYELQVLHGAAGALREGRLLHVVFEDHAIGHSAVASLLRSVGYTIYSLGWSLRGPELQSADVAMAHHYEAPSFLATLDPADATRRMSPRGWRALSPVTPRRRSGDHE